jgi:hypothetical protein
MIPRIRTAALALLTITLTLTACSTSAPPQDAQDAQAEPTCETIIEPSTVSALTDRDWTYEKREFRFGADVIEGGLECVWGDFTIASDQAQVFGWAPLDASAASAAQQKLISEGWVQADADGHVYITENPEFAIAADDDGYGMTYEFGDGWTTLADTRQNLSLISFP